VADASAVFNAILFGGYLESRPSQGGWVVQLPEDDVEGFKIILHIIHDQWQELPSAFYHLRTHGSTGEDWSCFMRLVFRVAIVADKYDLVYMLQPVADSWLRDVYWGCLDADTSSGYSAGILWAGWVFGDKQMIDREFGLVCLDACTDEDWLLAGGIAGDCYDDEESDTIAESCGALIICERMGPALLSPRLYRCGSSEEVYDILGLLSISGTLGVSRTVYQRK